MLEKMNSVKEFDQALADNDRVMAIFTLDWCGPSKLIEMPMKELATDETLQDIKFVQADIKALEALAPRYDIRATPALVCFKGGALVSSHVGAGQPSHLYLIAESLANYQKESK